MKSGIFDITTAEYFAGFTPAPSLSQSGIKTLLAETPADFAYEHPMLNPDREAIKANAAMRTGDVVHQLALGKGRGIAVGEFAAWQSNEAKAFKKVAEDHGLTPIVRAKYDEAALMAGIVRARIVETLNDIARERGLSAPLGGIAFETEVVFAWQEETAHGPVWCHGMADVWCESLGVILDPKVTAALTNERVGGHMHKQGWARQAAWYERGFSAIFPDLAGRITFANLMVKPKPPYTARAVSIPEAWRTVAESECDKALGIFARCLKTGEWPGYARGIETIEPPPWAMRMEFDLEEEADD